MKQYRLIAGITLVTFLAACSPKIPVTVPETDDEIIENVTAETENVSDATPTDATPADSEENNYEAQLKLFADDFADMKWGIQMWQDQMNDEVDINEAYKMAVADLNRNGRLELFVSSMQGTGLFSVTYMYEVSENYDTVYRLSSTDSDICADEKGDFLSHSVLNCYKRGDTYYYALDDYTPTGWRLIEDCLYAYSFESSMEHELIGGYTLRIDEIDYDAGGATSVSVKFYDQNKGYLDSAEALDTLIDDYWKDYEKQPCVNIKWVDFPQDDNCYETLKQSLDGYNEESADTCDLLPDYRSFHGEDAEYKVRHPEQS